MLEIVIRIRHEGRRIFENQNTDVHKELCTLSAY